MNSKIKGIICGIMAAVFYGTNPLGALQLYSENINTFSVIIWRYGLAVILLALVMLFQRKSFSITKHELLITSILGVLFSVSSLSLFMSFHYMDAGIASTLLFVYPIMVAVIMAIFFHERITISTLLSIMLALTGISLLYQGDGDSNLSNMGVALVFVSSLTYALYIVVLNKSSIHIPVIELTFYVLLFGIITVFLFSLFSDAGKIQMLTTVSMWTHAIILALFPTVLSLLLMVVAVHEIGSTPTAIMGALEPLTAVCIGVLIFGEAFTPRLAIGILLVLTAVMMIIAGKSLSINKATYIMSRLKRINYIKVWHRITHL